MYKILFVGLFALAVSNCSTIKSQDGKDNSIANSQQSNSGSANTPLNKTSLPTNDHAAIDEKDFTITKFAESAMKKTTLDKLPPEIIKFILDNESSGNKRLPAKINVSIQERDFNQDGHPEKIIYYRQYSNDEGVPLLLIFKNVNDKWDKVIFQAEGAPDVDIPEIEFLTKPDTKDFDLIKETLPTGGGSEVIYLQMTDDEYKTVECRKITSAENKIVPCEF